VPCIIVVGAAVVAINTDRPQLAVQMPGARPPGTTQSNIRAFGFKSGNGQRGLFVAIRETEQTFEGSKVRVLCAADGTGEIVAAMGDAYVAVNGAARSRAGSKTFWAVKGQSLLPIADSGFPNNVPRQFVVLERHGDAIIKTGVEMCPLDAPAADSAWRSLRSALENYDANARSLGISVP
jgi:hypothetical protein